MVRETTSVIPLCLFAEVLLAWLLCLLGQGKHWNGLKNMFPLSSELSAKAIMSMNIWQQIYGADCLMNVYFVLKSASL